MSDKFAVYRSKLQDACQFYGLNVSRETEDSVMMYMEELLKWNKTYNLTALKTLDDVFVQHILDSLSVVPEIEKCAGTDSFTLVDVGSGAGLPGIVLALWFPNAKVICVDSVNKKMTFVQYVAGKIGCKNVQAIHSRIEEIPPLNADIVISRAFASITDFVRLSSLHCKAGGHICAMKSVQVQEDIEEFSKSTKDWFVREVKTLQIPELDVTRNLVVIDRKAG